MQILLTLAAILTTAYLAAQAPVRGVVVDDSGTALEGANVYWSGTDIGTYADAAGSFELSGEGITDRTLIISYVGYLTDTVAAPADGSALMIWLEPAAYLDEATVSARQSGIRIADDSPIKTENITEAELTKAACCDLAGCFETQTTVTPQTTNVVTNAKELRMLGLSGVYNQVLIDGFPLIQGLTYTYGISSVPGTVVSNIYVAKGANSVLQGFESITGQINVLTKDPNDTDRLYLNTYLNTFGEQHYNANYAWRIKEWRNLTTAHVVRPAGRFDRDGDDFLDLPQLHRVALSNKAVYGNETTLGWHSKIGTRALMEERVGGQVDYNADFDRGSTQVYGQSVDISQLDVYTKTGYRFDARRQLVFFGSAYVHSQDNFFGAVGYQGFQSSVYTNVQYEQTYGSEGRHNIKAGISNRHFNIDEDIRFTGAELGRTYAGRYVRMENIVGAFGENSLSLLDGKLLWLAGLRVDYHNEFGTFVTPRTTLKYDVAPRTTLRGSFGTGWRTVNLFSENIGLLVSSRDIVFADALEPEQATNWGVNLTHKFERGNVDGVFTVDYYRTDFSNQIFPDYDTDPQLAIIDDFRGESASNTFQAETTLTLYRRWETKLGYSFLDAYRVIEGERRLLPFNARHKVITAVSYAAPSGKWQADANAHWYGRQRLPNTQANPVQFRRPDFSEPFTVVNAQFTYTFSDAFEVYAGCENIFDFRQLRQIGRASCRER